MTEKRCLECEGALPPPAATGRPRSYCAEPCRRAAEHRIARARRLAEWIERQLVGARVDGKAEGSNWSSSRRAPIRVKALETELEVAERRLRDLLAGARDHEQADQEH